MVTKLKKIRKEVLDHQRAVLVTNFDRDDKPVKVLGTDEQRFWLNAIDSLEVGDIYGIFIPCKQTDEKGLLPGEYYIFQYCRGIAGANTTRRVGIPDMSPLVNLYHDLVESHIYLNS